MNHISLDQWIVASNGTFAGSPDAGWRRIGRFDFNTNALLRREEHLFAGVGCGLFRIDATSGEWLQLHDETVTEVLALAPATGEPGTIIGGPYGIASGRRAEYDALRWSFHSDGLRVNERYTNVLLRQSEGVYLAGTEAGVIVFDARSGRFERTSLTGFPVRTIIAANGRWYAGCDGRGIWSSTDGLTWNLAGEGIDDATVLSLAFDGERIVAGSDRGVLVGTGAGSWHRCGPSVLAAAVAAEPATSRRWLIGCRPGGLFFTDDGGRTWRQSGSFTSVGALLPPDLAAASGADEDKKGGAR